MAEPVAPPQPHPATERPVNESAPGVILARALPTNERGEWRLDPGPGSGWVSHDDAHAWRLAATAVLVLHVGWGVVRLSLDDALAGERGCILATPAGSEDMAANFRNAALVAVAGPMVVALIRQDALSLTTPLAAECVGSSEKALLDAAAAQVPESRHDLLRWADWYARTIVLQHRAAFASLVQALLEQRVLDEAAVCLVWGQTVRHPEPSQQLHA